MTDTPPPAQPATPPAAPQAEPPGGPYLVTRPGRPPVSIVAESREAAERFVDQTIAPRKPKEG